MKPTIIIIFVLFSACLFTLQAQDRILQRDGKIIECKVLEIGSEVIKYSLAEYNFQVQFSIEKAKVDKILFENGQELVIDHAEMARESTETNSADLFLIQKKNAVKLNFLSPLSGSTILSFERAIKPGQSIEGSVGIIGLGFDNPDKALGFGLKGGYKFIRSPDFYLKGQRYAHILKGAYARPEIAFTSYQLRNEGRNVTKGAILLDLGKQWVYSDVFLIDIYGGMGYGFSNEETGDDFPYFITVGTDDYPIAFSFGFRIGFLL